MSRAAPDRPIPGCLRGFPGAVLRLSADGVVVDSNGRLEAALDRALVGAPFTEALDADSSGAKWRRLLDGAAAGPVTTELVLAGRDTLPEPRTFSVLREAGDAGLWLVEHPRDARLDALREQVTEVNSELVSTQRELLKERGRLAHALAEIERRNAELEATTRELERSNRALDEFAHVVSHDLKAPLRSIANHAQWLEEDHGGALPTEGRAQLATVRRQAGRMRAMIGGVLAYARAGRVHEEAREVDLGALVDDVVALLDPPPSVAVVVDGALPVIVAEAVPLTQVLQNLVDNAIKHARRADARVRVSARLEGDWCEVAVADDGPGISPRQQARIWALFHSGAPGDGAEHTGIGLALVRRLVEAQGGRVWVESEEGAGATFRFLWPTRPTTRD